MGRTNQRNYFLSGNVFIDPKNGKWTMRYKLPTGKDSRKILGPAWTSRGRCPHGYFTEATAQAALDALLKQYEGFNTGSDPWFEQARDEYLEAKGKSVNEGNFSAETLKTYRVIAVKGLTPWLEGKHLSEISDDLIEECRAELAERLAPSTLNQYRAVLNGIYKHARKARRYRGPDVMIGFERAKVRKKLELDVYTPAEVEALARAIREGKRWTPLNGSRGGVPWTEAERAEQARWDLLDTVIVKLAAYAGLRLSEVRALRWRDITFPDSRIFVRRGYTDEGGEGHTKGREGRSTPMAPQLAAELDRLSRRGWMTAPDDLVFPSVDGGVMSGDGIYNRFQKGCRAAGLRKVRFHDLRHTFGTMAVQKFALSDVQAMMGHKDISTTLIYIHYRPRSEEAAKLGDFISVDISGGIEQAFAQEAT